ncbi:hypothetical protein CCACVL1_00025, partial [Corchorus capsularis]
MALSGFTDLMKGEKDYNTHVDDEIAARENSQCCINMESTTEARPWAPWSNTFWLYRSYRIQSDLVAVKFA